MNIARERRLKMEKMARKVVNTLAKTKETGGNNLTDCDQQIVGGIVARVSDGGDATPEDVTLAFDFETADPQWEPDDPQGIVCAACDFLGVDPESVLS